MLHTLDTLTSAAVTKTPVLTSRVIDSNGGRVGYLLFNDHILTAEQPLVTAIQQMGAANANDLVLDLRYNGGGYLFMASQLAYMIAGSGPTAGQTFELQQFNDKHHSTVMYSVEKIGKLRRTDPDLDRTLRRFLGHFS